MKKNKFINILKKINKKIIHHINKRKYTNWYEDEFNIGSLQFIWGIKSYDDLFTSKANIWTMNDLEIDYDKELDKYMLSIETIYDFKEGKKGEVKYLKKLLHTFTQYMLDNNYNTDEELNFQLLQSEDFWTADSIPELYIKFKIFVNGYEREYRL